MSIVEKEWGDMPNFVGKYVEDALRVEKKIRVDEREACAIWLFRHGHVEASVALARSIIHDTRTETEETGSKTREED